MSATLTEVTVTAGPITSGWQAYRRVAGIHWPDAGRRSIGRAAVDLWTALEMHSRMEGWPASQARHEQEAKACRTALLGIVREYCGDGDAEFVAGGDWSGHSVPVTPGADGEEGQ